MGIEIKIEAESGEQMREQVASLFASVFGGVPLRIELPAANGEAEPEKPARAPRKPKAEVTEKVTSDGADAEGNAPTGSTEESTASSGTGSTQTEAGPSDQDNDEPTLTYADVQKAVTGLAAAKGRDAVVKVFNSFGVDHGTKLKSEQWADAVAELEAAKAA